MKAHAHLPVDRVEASRGWWDDPASIVRRANAAPADAATSCYRIGDVILEVDSTYLPLIDDLRNAYGDCAVANDAGASIHVRCSARWLEEESLVALGFDVPDGLPNLANIAFSFVRPRAELQHFAVEESNRAGWRKIANALDEREPLMAAGGNAALFNVRVEPPEVLLNFVIGVAQAAQPSVMFLHAGGVAIDGSGTIVIGRSGRGKSTTSVALASRGHALLGDETVGVRTDTGELVPFRRTLKLRPGPRAHAVAERLQVVPHAMRVDAQGVVCAWVRAGAMFAEPAPVRVPMGDVFFLREFRERAAVERFVPNLEHLDELQALTMSLSAVASWPLSPAHRLMRFVRVIDVFKQCRCWFLDLGTPDETAALIERTVRNHAQRS